MSDRMPDFCWALILSAYKDGIYAPTPAELDEHIQTTRAEAKAWFEDDSKEVNSFLWVCDWLDLDPKEARATVYKLWEASGCLR